MRITKKDSIIFEEKLSSLGYIKYNQNYKNEDYLYWKTFGKIYDEEGEHTSEYSCGFAFYNFSKYEQFKEEECIGVQMEFMIGNNQGIDRLDVSVSDTNLTLERFEQFCKDFYAFFKKSKLYKKEKI